MDLVGITVGIFVFFLVNAICGDVMLQNPQAGIFPGLVAAIWAAWPFFHLYSIRCYNLLHPAPRKYPVNAQNAFTRIHETLRENAYN